MDEFQNSLTKYANSTFSMAGEFPAWKAVDSYVLNSGFSMRVCGEVAETVNDEGFSPSSSIR